jgi:predicted AlkP superfamily phosphohydrolase/phosphomutase
MTKRISIIILLFLGCISAPSSYINRPKQKSKPRLIILGFDGVEPTWLETWMKKGLLPTIKELAQKGTYLHLKTTLPPQSPVAWTSFATGKTPCQHKIYDFIRRDPKRYLPRVGTAFISTAGQKISIVNLKKGTPFWKIIAEKIPVSLFWIPYSFPPDKMKKGRILCGVGVPDLRGTNSTFRYFSTALKKDQKVPGGLLIKLTLREDTAKTQVEGPWVLEPKKTKKRMQKKILFKINKNKLLISLGESKLNLKPGEFSPWQDIVFKQGKKQVWGIVRFFLRSIRPELEIYMSPIGYHPQYPYLPFSYPKDFAFRLYKEYGMFNTVGWAYDTAALEADIINEALFLKQLLKGMETRAKIALKEFKKKKDRLFIAIFSETDIVSHLFLRFINDKRSPFKHGIRKIYQKMDHIIKKFLSVIEPSDTLFIISDHGFHRFDKCVNLNTWLKKKGYLHLEGVLSSQFFLNVNWSKTRAYALGTGQIYINLKGREKEGIVNPGKEYYQLVEEIKKGLLALQDPHTGEKVIKEVFFRTCDDIYAPDIQIAYYDGYRTGWKSMLGGFTSEVIYPNLRKWRGDHAASHPSETKGIFLSNHPLSREDVSIRDIGSLVFEYFNGLKD